MLSSDARKQVVKSLFAIPGNKNYFCEKLADNFIKSLKFISIFLWWEILFYIPTDSHNEQWKENKRFIITFRRFALYFQQYVCPVTLFFGIPLLINNNSLRFKMYCYSKISKSKSKQIWLMMNNFKYFQISLFFYKPSHCAKRQF